MEYGGKEKKKREIEIEEDEIAKKWVCALANLPLLIGPQTLLVPAQATTSHVSHRSCSRPGGR
jgi:hypothetical protein